MASSYLFSIVSCHSLPQTLELVCPFLCMHIHFVTHLCAFAHAVSSSGNSCLPHLANYYSSFKTLLRRYLLQIFPQWSRLYYYKLGLDASPVDSYATQYSFYIV